MSRRVHDLTLAGLHDLPAPCRSCVFWESPEGRQGGEPDPRSGAVAKDAWWQATQLEWGTPGKALYLDDHLVGFAVFAPSPHFPRARLLGPASEDALLLATLWVDPAYRGLGVATTLLQSVLRETHRRGARALEAYGDRRPVLPLPRSRSSCTIPEGWLLRAGFAVRAEHHAFPLLRLDLRQTVRWQESVGHALEGVISVLGRRERAQVPAPVTPAVRSAPRGNARPRAAGR